MTPNYDNLNNPVCKVRLAELERLISEHEPVPRGIYVNNHIHTFYSFSPYSPTAAIWQAYLAGLKTAGIMDHDSVSGLCEFASAGKIAGIATTGGVECRARFFDTKLANKRLNNPDQIGIGYMAIHAIAPPYIQKAAEFFAFYNQQRNIRNKKMIKKLNGIIKNIGITLIFDEDVFAISKANEGGSITERHILFALALKIIKQFKKGKGVLDALEKIGININDNLRTLLEDAHNPYYEYDLLGVLKSNLVSSFYIDAFDECPDISELISFAASINAIAAYAYLGDVGQSVTGDKKTQKFEDDYLELLFSELKALGINAITYMPSRNSRSQLERVRNLCDRYQFMQISGEDINSPRQSFICKQLSDPTFQNLIDATWSLIEHERKWTK